MQRLRRELKVRQAALPTLQAKETALRLEIIKLTEKLRGLEDELRALESAKAEMAPLWLEFPDVLSIESVDLNTRNVAGSRIPEVAQVYFNVRPYSLFAQRAWLPGGTAFLEKLVTLQIQVRMTRSAVDTLNYARRKTTQKVNLYEKVQIPAYVEALRKIKRFLEDQENLSRAAQKIVKARNTERDQAS